MSKYSEVLTPFMALMEKELHENSGKGDRPGWLAMSSETCLLEIFYHLGKLQKAIRKGEGDSIKEYAADTANLCMMLLDICGALPIDSQAIQDEQKDDEVSERSQFKAWCYRIGYTLRESAAGNGYSPGYGSELFSAWKARAALAAPVRAVRMPDDQPQQLARLHGLLELAVEVLKNVDDLDYTGEGVVADIERELDAAAQLDAQPVGPES